RQGRACPCPCACRTWSCRSRGSIRSQPRSSPPKWASGRGFEAVAEGDGAGGVLADLVRCELYLHPERDVLGIGRRVDDVAPHAGAVAVDDGGHEGDVDALGGEAHDREGADRTGRRDVDLAELRTTARGAGA